ncbi:MAG TPA: hypothetical protein VLB79_02155 [Solirubrobacterales bacterium]|nr:hypothetical protein [Solirubrobacterales bacterium]
MRARLVLIASLLLVLLGAGSARAAIRIYENSEAATYLGEVRKAKCKVKGSGANRRFHAGARTTNGAYTLDVTILGFRGFGKEYNVPYGQISTTVDLEGVGSPVDYSNAYPFPGGQPPGGAGAVAFPPSGKKFGLGVYALPNQDYSQGVALAGGAKCRYPR